MKEQRIVVSIDREGRITANADGFKGDACLAELERLLDGLASGEPVIERKTDRGAARRTQRKTQTLGKTS